MNRSSAQSLAASPVFGNTGIDRYFDTLNAQRYEETANLFSEDGVLYPPFGSPVKGPEAIASYLAKEAVDMRLEPRRTELQTTAPIDDHVEADATLIKVFGKVHLSLFTVNVQWDFQIQADQSIQSVRVKLLASLQELAAMR